MMRSNAAISVESIGKMYEVSLRKGAGRLYDRVGSQLLRRSRENSHRLWALRDVSFEVQHGEIMGVIGRNGSGKSTLMKVLSRVTFPSEGRARCTGEWGHCYKSELVSIQS